jgi:hypothetical protein
MEASSFDRLTRSLSAATSRRAILPSLAAAAVGLGMASHLPQVTIAKQDKKERKKKKKLVFNQFGSVDVDSKCRGKDDACCSGLCEGKKPKKGKKDKRHCVAHDTGTGCMAGQRSPFCQGMLDPASFDGEGMLAGSCTTSAGVLGACETTTGNAPYCQRDRACARCSKDTECEAVCGQGAVCGLCAGCVLSGGTACFGPASSACGLD